MRLHKFQVISRIPPTALRVDGLAVRNQTSNNVIVDVGPGLHVNRSVCVVEMPRRCAQRRRDKVRPVAFVLIKIKIIPQRRSVKIRRRIHRKTRRRRRNRPAHRNRINSGSAHLKVDGINAVLPPRPQRRSDRSGDHVLSRLIRNRKLNPAHRLRRHQISPHRNPSLIPNLVDANIPRDRRRPKSRQRRNKHPEDEEDEDEAQAIKVKSRVEVQHAILR